MSNTDAWLSAGKFSIVNDLFEKANISKLNLDAIIGLLVFTRFAIDQLPSRAKFIAAVSAMSSSFDEEDYDYVKDLYT